MVKKHRLSAACSYDYSITGIATQLKDFKLCLFINQALGIKLRRVGDIPVNASEKGKLLHFPLYRYYDPPHRINWYLIANRNHQQQVMLSELKELNFFLVNNEMPPFLDINTFISSLKQIAGVQMAQQISLSTSKGLSYLLQDLEIYTLELDKQSKPRPLQNT